MIEIEFGSRKKANETRDKLGGYLHPKDTRRSKTVKIKDSAPDSIIERVESEAFGSQTSDRQSYGQANLTEREKQTLKRTTSFTWQQHGFEAMSAKAALQAQGATEWTDYYSPGEGVESSLAKLRSAKGGAQQSRAGIGIDSMRQDQAEQGNRGRRSRQAEQASAKRVDSAKEPALLDQDTEAIGFLREEQRFNDDVFDIAFSGTDPFGRPVGSGRDYDTLQERHEQRSSRAQELDEQKHAEITRDPIEWSQNPAQFDFPGIDTLDPRQKHESRPEDEQKEDEAERATIADSVPQWGSDMDGFDLPGIDTPK